MAMYLSSRVPGFQNAKNLTDAFSSLSLSIDETKDPGEEKSTKEGSSNTRAKRTTIFEPAHKTTVEDGDDETYSIGDDDESMDQEEKVDKTPKKKGKPVEEARDPLSSLPREERTLIESTRFADSVLSEKDREDDDDDDDDDDEEEEDFDGKGRKRKRDRSTINDWDDADQLHIKALKQKRREELARERSRYVGTPFDKSLDEMDREMAEYEAEWLNSRRLLDRREALFFDSRQTDGSAGDEYFRMADELLDTLTTGKSHRSADQKRFHDAFMQTCAPHIYGDDFLKARERLLKKWNRQEFNMATMIMTPRRWGKSTATAMAAAVLMYLCREVKIVIISTTREMSKTLMDMIKKYYTQLPGADTKVLAHNQEEFLTACIDQGEGKTKDDIRMGGHYNSIKARASTVHGNKGITADIFLLDEAARIPQMIMDEVIAPMMMVKNTVMLALSTPLDSDNYYTKLFNKKNMDEKTRDLFIQFKIDLLCEDCFMKKKDPRDCKHLEHLRPPWLVSDNAERVKLLMASDTFAREVLGAVYSSTSCIYEEEFRERLKKKRQISLREWLNNSPPTMMWTFIDPAGGGDSDCAIVTILSDRNAGTIILGMGSAPTVNARHVENFVTPYFKHLAGFKELENVHHYIMTERNYGGGPCADAAYQKVMQIMPDTTEYRSDPLKPGVWTSQPIKNDAFQTFAYDLADDQISFCSEWFYAPYKEKREDMYNKLFDQMSRIKKVKRGLSHSFSGKPEGGGRRHGGSGQDDMMIALVHAIYYRNRMIEESAAKDTMFERRLEARGIFDAKA